MYNKTKYIYDYVNVCTYGLFNYIYHLPAANRINRNLLTLRVYHKMFALFIRNTCLLILKRFSFRR